LTHPTSAHQQFVRRHPVDPNRTSWLVEQDRDDRQEVIKVARTDPNNLSFVVHNGQSIAALGASHGLSAGKIYEALTLYHEALLGILVGGVAAESYTIPLGGELVTYHRRVDLSHLGPVRWLKSYWLCHILRDESSRQLLARMSVDVFRASPTRSSEYSYRWMSLMQEAEHGVSDEVMCDRLKQLIELTAPAEVRELLVEHAERIGRPALRVLLAVYEGDEAAYRARLHEALLAHRAYYDSDVDDRRHDAAGFISFDLCGIVSLAWERGMKRYVESDYLPGYMVEGAFRYPPLTEDG
jgi:hypothetical protein